MSGAAREMTPNELEVAGMPRDFHESIRRKSEYRLKINPVKAVMFAELVRHGIAQGVPLNNGMPWSFTYEGLPVTHENDRLYLITWKGGVARLGFDDVLVTTKDGEAAAYSVRDFAEMFEPIAEFQASRLTYFAQQFVAYVTRVDRIDSRVVRNYAADLRNALTLSGAGSA